MRVLRIELCQRWRVRLRLNGTLTSGSGPTRTRSAPLAGNGRVPRYRTTGGCPARRPM